MGHALKLLGFDTFGHGPELLSPEEYHMVHVINGCCDCFASVRSIPADLKGEISQAASFLIQLFALHEVWHDYPLGHECIHPFVKKILLGDDCRFIYLDRDDESWLESVRKWTTSHLEANPHADKLWQYPLIARTKSLHDKKKFRTRYVQLQAEYPKDVLFMNVRQGWGPLCDFLGLPPLSPDVEFPWRAASGG